MSSNYSAGVQTLRNAGYKLTSPRLTILEVLDKSDGQMTSAELLSLVEERDPSIGRASVFRTLDLMTKLGIIWSSVQGSSTIHHLLMPGGHHHHIVCTNCHKLIEFDDCRLEAFIASLEQKYGVQIEGHLLELFGLCENCHSELVNREISHK